MRTDDLIAALAKDPVPVTPPIHRLVWRALALGLPVAALAMVLALGIRPDAVEAALGGWFVLKLAIVALVALAGYALVDAAARPGRPLPWLAVTLAAGVLIAAMATDLKMVGLDGWRGRAFGDNALLCLLSIPLLGAAPLALLILALREGAPTRPALAGAVAGLLAGGLAGFLYGLHCPDDSPFFVAFWYGLAIALLAGAGALAGRRWLSW